MRRALDVAARARGLTSPNPMVGALVVSRDGLVVGEACHQRAGDPHAEIEALAYAGEHARGGTLYVTLEPCNHYGRTPPCAPAVVAAGVARVVYAMRDPNPRVEGGGAAHLRAAGVVVDEGVLREDAERLNRAFVTAMRRGRPHVTLKAAMTADGKIADVAGTSRWITGEAARAAAHRLRADSDAIVVGVTTVLRDDPALTVRLARPWPREPYRIVLDAAARTPPDAQVLRAGVPARAIIVVADDAPERDTRRLVDAGATLLHAPAAGGHVDIHRLLAWLHEREARAVLVEGGAEVHGAFVDAGAVDRVALFLAPLLLGGRGATPAVGGAGRELKSALRLGPLEVRRIGDDIVIEADVLDAVPPGTPEPRPAGNGSRRRR